MVVSLKKHFATEKQDLRWCINEYPKRLIKTKVLVELLNNNFKTSPNSKFLEIGAAQGLTIIALNKLGYHSEGIEPSDTALQVSKGLEKEFGIKLNIKKGYAEYIPFADNSFDVIIALSVMEHVKDVDKVFIEVYRVLKDNGCFYFSTTSILNPKQDEIRFFPFFSWYPQKIKLKIFNWAIRNKPSLVGYTDHPAINWFSPWGTKKLIKQVGFYKLHDRWDLINDNTIKSKAKRTIIRIIKSNKFSKIIADIFIPGCKYLVIKGK